MNRANDREAVRLARDARQRLREVHARDRRGGRPQRAADLFRREGLGVERVALVRAAELKEDDAGLGGGAPYGPASRGCGSGSMSQGMEQPRGEQAGWSDLQEVTPAQHLAHTRARRTVHLQPPWETPVRTALTACSTNASTSAAWVR
jgi:hypothetical protein